jgi:hypothetical protein
VVSVKSLNKSVWNKMNTRAPVIFSFIRRYILVRNMRLLVKRLIFLAGLSVFLFCIYAAMDRFWDSPVILRISLWIVMLAVTGYSATLFVLLLLREKISAPSVELIKKENPGLRHSVSHGYHLSRLVSSYRSMFSPALVKEAIAQKEEHLRNKNPGRYVPLRVLTIPALSALVFISVFGLCLIAFPDFWKGPAERLANPFKTYSALRQLAWEVEPGDTVIFKGDSHRLCGAGNELYRREYGKAAALQY